MSGLSPYPRDVIIDQNGIIQYMNSEYDPQYMLQTVNNLLGINEVVNQSSEKIPQKFELKIFPNPFNPVTTISFNIIEASPVKLEIYNMLGQKIQSHHFDKNSLGEKTKVIIEMKNQPSGVYYLAVRSRRFSQTAKLLLLR
jgi:hypothetical protein